MNTRRYRHILIDADNTILDFAVCEKRILEAMALEYGFMPVTTAGRDLTTAYREINVELWKQFEEGRIAPDDLRIERFRRLVEVLDFSAVSRPVDPAILNRQFIARLSRCGDVVPTATPVLRAIAPVVVVTNGFADVQRLRLEASGLGEYIDGLFISEEIGAAKPQREFFDHVLAALGDADPAECIMIGDSLSSDIVGGNRAGIDTVWLDRSAMLGETAPEPTGERRPTWRITRLVELKDIILS